MSGRVSDLCVTMTTDGTGATSFRQGRPENENEVLVNAEEITSLVNTVSQLHQQLQEQKFVRAGEIGDINPNVLKRFMNLFSRFPDYLRAQCMDQNDDEDFVSVIEKLVKAECEACAKMCDNNAIAQEINGHPLRAAQSRHDALSIRRRLW